MIAPEIRLRALEPDDVDCIYLWENSPGMWRHGCSPAPLSRHQIWQYVQNYDADPFSAGQLRLIISDGMEAVGAVDLYEVDVRNRRAMVGIMVAPEQRRRGVARAALRGLERYCFEALGLEQLAATVECGNEPSRHLFSGAGYAEAAMLPRWFRVGVEYADAVIYRKFLS